MASRIRCPDCKSVLNPAKPVADGKRVKCPRCGGVFTAPGAVEEDEERPRLAKASGRKAKVGKKKAGIKKAAPPPKKPSGDEEGGVYSFANVNELENAERPDITYAPDTSIKDLRGPAQEAVTKPSNFLILKGGLSCIGSIFMIAFALWPFGFSETLLDHKKVLGEYYIKKASTDAVAANRLKNLPDERKDLKDNEKDIVEAAEEEEMWWRLSMAGTFFFVLIYCGFLIIGAVKVQNLESRRWGIVAAVMMLFPPGTGGIVGVVYTVCYYTVAAFLFADKDERQTYSAVFAGVDYLMGVVVAIWSLKVFLSQKVIRGFEYKAD